MRLRCANRTYCPFHRLVERGVYPSNWATPPIIENALGERAREMNWFQGLSIRLRVVVIVITAIFLIGQGFIGIILLCRRFHHHCHPQYDRQDHRYLQHHPHHCYHPRCEVKGGGVSLAAVLKISTAIL